MRNSSQNRRSQQPGNTSSPSIILIPTETPASRRLTSTSRPDGTACTLSLGCLVASKCERTNETRLMTSSRSPSRSARSPGRRPPCVPSSGALSQGLCPALRGFASRASHGPNPRQELERPPAPSTVTRVTSGCPGGCVSYARQCFLQTDFPVALLTASTTS